MKSETVQPSASVLFTRMNIVDQSTISNPDPQKTLSGTGPFKWVEWRQGQSVNYARNTSYWQSERPYLDELQIKVFADAQSMVVQMETGDVDYSPSVGARDVQRLKTNNNFKVEHFESGALIVLVANMANEPTANKKLRQAMNFAVDRQRFIDTVQSGIGKATSIVWPDFSLGYVPELVNAYKYDLDKAKALVAESGVSNPTMELLYVGETAFTAPFGQLWQADLAKIGINITFRAVDNATWLQIVAPGNSTLKNWTVSSTSSVQLDPDNIYGASPYSHPTRNVTGFSSPRYTELVAMGNRETDVAKRRAIYQELTKIQVDESVFVPVNFNPGTMTMRSKVQGMSARLSGSINYTDAWLSA
jgi:peptide/nickel transport system substrate-binding protein